MKYQDGAGSRQESGLRVFGVDAALDCMTAWQALYCSSCTKEAAAISISRTHQIDP